MPTPARADSVASVVAPRPATEPVAPLVPVARAPELTAADVATAPIPGEESGRMDPVGDGDTTPRKIARALLFIPRYTLDFALTPLRASVWATERYHLVERYHRTFFNDAQTIGLYPTLSVDTTLGITVGAGFVHRDLFGDHEQLGLLAAAGSRYRQIYAASFATGNRLGHRFSLELDAGYERRPHDSFYGIGNGDRVDATATPIDPRTDSTSVTSRYRQDRARLRVTADIRAWDHLHLRPAGELSEVQFGNGDDADDRITDRYDRRGLVGFDGVQYGYAELELRWDSRRSAGNLEPRAVYSNGSLAAVFGGRVNRIDNGPDFWRYGIDLEHFLRLARGPRVIIGHVHAEAVTGRRDEVPFTELPSLGGPTYLRGYDLDQFRDRIAAFGSLAYKWDLSQWVSASLFTDAGRVYQSADELSLDGLRVGYGVSLEGHSLDSFLLELSVASSIDGGLFLNLSFNPVYDLDQRVRRR
jgi:hypothetical protein